MDLWLIMIISCSIAVILGLLINIIIILLEISKKLETKNCLKTHKVVDTLLTGNTVYIRSLDECSEWKLENGFGYRIKELDTNEFKLVNIALQSYK